MPARAVPFGKYELLEKVASGGMAEVWRARVRETGEILAIKRILPAIAADEAFITMFLDEARVTVQLAHPGVVQIRDLGQIDGSYFIAMEYLGAQNLRSVLDRERGHNLAWDLPIPFAVSVSLAVCEALDYVHRSKDTEGRSLRIVHRDVSPENILVSYEGDVKLIDFGIAKASTASNRTRAGLIKGKLAYLSPEQSRGVPIDGRSDIFSMGAVLSELLTGERLFLAENEYATVMAVRERPIRPPSIQSDRVPPALDAIVLRALERDLEGRYQSAGEMAADLRQFLFKQTHFGRDDLAAYVQASFPEEYQKEKEARESFGGPPEPISTPTYVPQAAGAMLEKTEPHGVAPRFSPYAGTVASPAVLPPVAKRRNSFKTLIVPILEATGVYRRATTRPPRAYPQQIPVAAPLPREAATIPAPPPVPALAVPYPDEPPPARSPLPWLLVLLAAALGVVAVAAPKLMHREGRGYLVVNASPANAIVAVDGARQTGQPPLVLEVSAGLHRVRVEAAGFATDEREVVIEPGGQQAIDVSLAAAR
ncbi:MAG TPA: serine/threonine-protein kinase [Myxococcales bacterium]|nr:serine/threonine-protein kinase [Myxococcales bacterium]